MLPICVAASSFHLFETAWYHTYDRQVVVHDSEQKVFLFVSVYLFKSSLSVELSGFFCSPCFAVRDVLDILRWSRSPRVGSQVDGKLAIPNLTFCTWYITDRTLPPPIVAPFPSLPFRNHTGIMHPQLCHATLPLSSSPLSYCELGICNL